MNLIDNWRRIAFRSYSMWSLYLGLLALLGSEILYGFFGIEADPYPLGKAALAFFIIGIFGRLIRQDAQSVVFRRGLFLTAFAYGLVMLFQSLGGAVIEDRQVPEYRHEVRIEQRALIIPAMAGAPAKLVKAGGVAPEGKFLALAVPFIGEWEGLRLVAYKDVVGVWTVCFGETKGVRPGDRYTVAECEAILAREILSYRQGLHRYFTPSTLSDRLPAKRDVAYVSLAYNVGVSRAGTATATKRLNAGDVPGGCEALTWYNKAGGRVWRGLVRRRSAEKVFCMAGVIA